MKQHEEWTELSKRERRVYLLLLALEVLLGVTAFILPLLLNRRGAELALSGFSTGIGILFTLALSVSCFLSNLKNTARDKMFFAMVALAALQLFFMELYSAGYGTVHLRRVGKSGCSQATRFFRRCTS